MSELSNLIPISYDNPERPTVSGRELHEFLEVNTPYRIWFPRMVEYGFTEGEDFNPYKNVRVQSEGNREVERTIDGHMICAKMARVDGSAIRENIYYTLKNGEFVEVEP